jgi:oxalate decarboxylase
MLNGTSPSPLDLTQQLIGRNVECCCLGIVEHTASQGAPKAAEENRGAPALGPRNLAREAQSPDLRSPPKTDHGALPNLRFSFADAHMKVHEGGWAREVTARELPAAATVAGVNMRLVPGGVRELHWHKEAEWSFMLAGTARITALDAEGHNFIADVGPGDLWYFPAGIPHSIQGLPPDGCEFLLAFPNGQFSEHNTFSLSDLFGHMPKSALAKNFAVDTDAFDRIPHSEQYILLAPVPPPLHYDAVTGLQPARHDMIFRLADQPAKQARGGQVRVVDTGNFPISSAIAAAWVKVDPGHLREIHWHPNADEWQYYICGQARMTVFGAEGTARTFDFQAGDVGTVPKSMAHYVENTGDSPLQFLELFRAERFVDVSLAQWMALTPHELVEAHLHLDRQLLDTLRKEKLPVV